ncbi:hypothetical protein Pnap_4411 (plasmid) [Polaromonas naphthalenivorans CJ2]|uniref:Uncharacterized protein n=2 Tax=Polaromonas naphthalenivorans TaxID=216465 RepID=A1VVL1_POLNA|nr:hypothetical protein Pnap_4411 [Polaromonas naphthalenivorans CJ2]
MTAFQEIGMSDSVFEVLRAAVGMARAEQVQRLATLKLKLLEVFPGRQEDIASAIAFWAAHARMNRSGADQGLSLAEAKRLASTPA